jgi:hypothetical protein
VSLDIRYRWAYPAGVPELGSSKEASMHRSRSLAVLVLGLVAIASSAMGQSRSPRDPAEIQRKIQRSAELQRQALQALADPPRAERLVNSAYAQMQSAYTDMVINSSNMKMPDPLSGINSRKAQQALTHLQSASDALKNSLSQPAAATPKGEESADQAPDTSRASSYVEGARSSLDQALRLTNSMLF